MISSFSEDDLLDQLPLIRVPCLVLHGSNDWLKACQPALIGGLTSTSPTVHEISQSSHFPHLENPEEHNSKGPNNRD